MIVLIFENIHYLMLAEEILKKEKIHYNLIPTPKNLARECGMSLEINHNIKDKVIMALNDSGINLNFATFEIQET